MTAEESKQFIIGGQWISIAPELRPSSVKNAAGDIQPFYLTRQFEYFPGDGFECIIINYADPSAKIPLVKIRIKGHLAWQGEHPLTAGAYKLDYIADEVYEATPVHPNFAAAMNKIPGLDPWSVDKVQDLKGKTFPLFSLIAGQTYVDYDLIYIYNEMLFNGSKNVDGRPFDKPENRPTNLQLPLVRKSR